MEQEGCRGQERQEVGSVEEQVRIPGGVGAESVTEMESVARPTSLLSYRLLLLLVSLHSFAFTISARTIQSTTASPPSVTSLVAAGPASPLPSLLPSTRLGHLLAHAAYPRLSSPASPSLVFFSRFRHPYPFPLCTRRLFPFAISDSSLAPQCTPPSLCHRLLKRRLPSPYIVPP